MWSTFQKLGLNMNGLIVPVNRHWKRNHPISAPKFLKVFFHQ